MPGPDQSIKEDTAETEGRQDTQQHPKDRVCGINEVGPLVAQDWIQDVAGKDDQRQPHDQGNSQAHEGGLPKHHLYVVSFSFSDEVAHQRVDARAKPPGGYTEDEVGNAYDIRHRQGPFPEVLHQTEEEKGTTQPDDGHRHDGNGVPDDLANQLRIPTRKPVKLVFPVGLV